MIIGLYKLSIKYLLSDSLKVASLSFNLSFVRSNASRWRCSSAAVWAPSSSDSAIFCKHLYKANENVFHQVS